MPFSVGFYFHSPFSFLFIIIALMSLIHDSWLRYKYLWPLIITPNPDKKICFIRALTITQKSSFLSSEFLIFWVILFQFLVKICDYSSGIINHNLMNHFFQDTCDSCCFCLYRLYDGLVSIYVFPPIWDLIIFTYISCNLLLQHLYGKYFCVITHNCRVRFPIIPGVEISPLSLGDLVPFKNSTSPLSLFHSWLSTFLAPLLFTKLA